ncbi:ArnT family glycosyltransferase [Micromonospora sp. NPDC051141]|uniref:ArnT family glycosyltransferase n=1 Tax=Micromonospora sp. NPDC051141 TaxID=3364284 RepID=UPI00378A0D80
MSSLTESAPIRVAGPRTVPGRLRRLLRGRPADPAWARPALLVLLAATAVLYLWDPAGRGWANPYYAGAVQSGTQDAKAFFFGSVDAANFITVDKPPASLWLMAISGRIFGFTSWSMLLPQALAGVAAVALLAATVRRWHGPAAGLIAGAALAVTPVAVLMFRYNNPDALLVLLLVLAAWATTRAVEQGRIGWLLLAGSAIGFGFLTKMLQAFLVLPALALTYLVAAPVSLRRRLGHLVAGGTAMTVAAGWWVAVVELWPAADRPYVGGSEDDSVLGLTLGYNGLGRILGGDGNGAAGAQGGGPGLPAGTPLPAGVELPAGGPAGMSGATGIGRMFGDAIGGQVSWLLPAALVALVLGVWLSGRAPRTDRLRASVLLWGGWLLVTAAVFSFMAGIFHEYYTVALAPAIAALVGLGGRELWVRRETLSARLGLAAMVAATAAWGYVLLDRTPDWYPALRYALAALGVVAVVGLLPSPRRALRLSLVGLVAALLTGALGSTAYAVQTASSARSGPIPTAGPRGGGFPGGAELTEMMARMFPGGRLPAGFPEPPVGGGLPGGEVRTDDPVAKLLRATTTTWAAAVVSSSDAASLQLAGGRPVMGLGGFTGSDPAPTLTEFQRHVADGDVRYLVATGGVGGTMPGAGGPMATSASVAAITDWVSSTFASTTIGGRTVYDLTKEKN